MADETAKGTSNKEIDKQIAKAYAKRIASEEKSAAGVYNYMLCCKDCVYRLSDAFIRSNTGRCEEYPHGKPNAVLLGFECLDYLKE